MEGLKGPPGRGRRTAVVVALRAESAQQADNARRVLRALGAAGLDELWLVEPTSSPARLDLERELPGLHRRLVASERSLLERARLVNAVLADTRAERLWIHDPDLMLPFAEIAARLDSSAEIAIQPFTAYRRARREHEPPVAAAFGKASFVVDRDVLRALGGLSEAFVGRADEGFELVRRLKRFFCDIAVYEHTGVELWRPRSVSETASRHDNKRLQDRLAAAIDDDVERYLTERLQSSIPADLGALRRLARRSARERALRVTRPTPPPRLPARLPGSLWAVTALFNPVGYASKRANYRRFRAGLLAAKVPLFAVELAFGDAPFELGAGDAEHLVQLRARDVLWQKERLLNLAVARLPADCDKVVWLDADVLFERPDWAERTSELLEDYVALQPFSRSTRLLPGESSIPIDELPIGSGEHELLHSMAYGVYAKGRGCLDRYLEHGHSGYAWAARRELLERHGLYDANVLGNGDLNIAHALFSGRAHLRSERLSPAARAHLERWAEAIHRDARGSVTYVDGTVYHLWHGRKESRRYLDRLAVLIDHDYDPERDLTIDASGAYRWASAKPELHALCRDYFRQRREDDGIEPRS